MSGKKKYIWTVVITALATWCLCNWDKVVRLYVSVKGILFE